jgi:Domain of unknown function (DUF4286)
MESKRERVLYIVRTWVPDELLDEWNQWHTYTHVPEVVEQPQVRRGRKYRVAEDNTPVEWAAQYVTIYEFDSWEDWESYNRSEAVTRLRKDYDERYGAIGKISRQVIVEVADVESLG